MYFFGYDVGSSSVKASLLDGDTGEIVARATSPAGEEMPIDAPQAGWAEQPPEMWWEHLKKATAQLLQQHPAGAGTVGGIGISYQMHGLVLIDKEHKVLRPSIIWCDSRAVETGEKAFRQIGEKKALEHLLNSPGNFTAAKLAWVKEHEPQLYERAWKFLLPGDYIALRMTGEAATTITGLSEGIFWDFRENDISADVVDAFGFDPNLFPVVVPVFGEQGRLTEAAARELGLPAGVPVTYRAGDQPNNAFSLNVLEPGEVAATAGTSGVVYGVSDTPDYDPLSRVNTFVHVNHRPPDNRYGVLLCINGTGILNAWLRRNLFTGEISYEAMNEQALAVPPGAEGLTVLPFGNGAERILSNRNPGALFEGMQFNIHTRAHLLRAAQEGIAFSFRYGLEIMKETGMDTRVIRAGHANMFLSPLFTRALAATTGIGIELYDTDGAQGAALGAALGAGFYKSPQACFRSLHRKEMVEPDERLKEPYEEAYCRWLDALEKITEEE
jgi:xylulokinase